MSRILELVVAILLLAVLAVGAVVGILRSIKAAEDPAKMAFKWLLSIPLLAVALTAAIYFGVPGIFFMVLCAVILSYMWTPHLAEFIARPITSLFDGGNLPPEKRPLYSVAQSKQKRGEYLEAVGEIQAQLERFPRDFEGHVLLAQILAENLHDIASAESVIQRLCSQSGHAPKNVAFALYSMADWHLRYAGDRQAAGRNFEQVIEKFPNSEFALGAAQRIAHLGGPEMTPGSHEPKKYAVPQGPRRLGLARDQGGSKPPEQDPALQASEYVAHLQQHPLDTEAREKLAAIYADHYRMLALATDQFEQMIQHPNQPARLVVRWLNMLADTQIRCGADYETIRRTLQRIIDRDPKAATADTARKRIDILKLQLKANEQPAAVKLGTYEQNIGLKRARKEDP
jgi:outer membrane protein assembly factor BamD (BamD/ComL family)